MDELLSDDVNFVLTLVEAIKHQDYLGLKHKDTILFSRVWYRSRYFNAIMY